MNFKNFMSGRYGRDELNSFCLWLYIVLLILNIFIRSKAVSIAVVLLAVIVIYRTFSKKIYVRRRENTAFLSVKNKTKKKISLFSDMIKSRKTHIYRKCPHCRAAIKLPRKKGKHSVICPKCKNVFAVKCRGRI